MLPARFFIIALLAVCAVETVDAADFTLTEHLGKTWTNERVTFPLNASQAEKAKSKAALLGPDGNDVPWQLVREPKGGARICFQTNLAAYEHREFTFANNPAAAKSDLQVREVADGIVAGNGMVGLAIRKTLADGQGPIAGIRLRSGQWTGGSSLTGAAKVKDYKAVVTARGPVFVEVVTQVTFEDGGRWNLRFRIENAEPVVLVEEIFDVPTGGTFSLSLGGKAFRPTHMLNRDSRVESAVVRSEPVGNFLIEPWLRWNNNRHGNWLALFTPAGNKDMLTFAAVKPSLWRDPKWSGRAKQVAPNVNAAVQDGLMAINMPVQGGRRSWLLGALDRSDSVAILEQKNKRVAAPPQQLIIKHGDFPLDKVKDFVLDWHHPGDHNHHPVLHVRKQDLPELKKGLKSNPAEIRRWVSQQPINKYLLESPIREFLASGDPRLGKRMGEKAEEYLQTCVDRFLKQDYLHCPGTAPHMQTLIVSVLNLIDPVLSTEAFTPEARKRVLAKLAFMGYVVSSPDYWSPERGYTGFANMTSIVALYRAGLGCMLPSHPHAKDWAKQGLDQFRWQLYAWSDENGGWLEAPHYAMVSLDHMIAGFSMAANAGYDDYAFDPRLRKVFEWYASIMTPRDSRTGDFRHLPPIGNTYHGEPSGICGVAASIWKDRDPDFAARMQWMFEEGGSFGNLGIGWNFPSMLGYRWMMKQTGITPKPADFGSTLFPKTGVVLRNTMHARETFLHLIAGSNHDHYDIDSGSIMLYGKGRILSDDWGYIGRHPGKWHSMLSSSSANAYGNMAVDVFEPGPALDYVSGRKGAWQRQIAFSKDANPMAANYFLIRDTHNAQDPATWRLWLMPNPHPEAAGAKAPKVPNVGGGLRPNSAPDLSDDLLGELEEEEKQATAPAQPGVVVHDRGATLIGGEDVDLDIFIYQPGKLNLQTETATQRVSAGYRNGREGPQSITQTALIGTLNGGGSITTLLYPRLKSEQPPKVTWRDGGNVVEIETPAGKECLFMAPKPQRKPITGGLVALPKGDTILDCPSYSSGGTGLPWLIVNKSDAEVSEVDTGVTVRLGPGQIAVHPSMEPVTVAWQSPIDGVVSVESHILGMNPAINERFPEKSDGVTGELRKGKQTLGQVAVPRAAPEAKLSATNIPVRQGELLRLVILPNASNWFDSTRINMQVSSEDGQKWNLSESLSKGEKLGNDLASGVQPVWWACAGDGDEIDSSYLTPLPLPKLSAFGGSVKFRGTTGSVRIRKEGVTMSLGEAGEIRFGKHTLASDGSASKTERAMR